MTIELSDCETVLNGRKKTVICVEFLGYIFHAAMPAFAVRRRRCLPAVTESQQIVPYRTNRIRCDTALKY